MHHNEASMTKAETRYNNFIIRWLNNKEDGMRGTTGISRHIRAYLFEKHDSSCQLCGWSKVHSKTGLVPLEIHHIDGDHKNNRFDNLQLLCPNCHSLTDTNGKLNNGNGRHYTRIYK
jgi:5-methylcytosine-specific restriction endonuclease McrA